MKLPAVERIRQRGAIFLVVAVAVVALVVIGYTAWKIYQAASKLGAQHASHIERAGGESLSNIVENIVADYPNQPFTIVSLQTNVVTEITPFDPAAVRMTIQRSTNLVDWETVATIAPGETYTDPAPPWPQGFYRRLPSQ